MFVPLTSLNETLHRVQLASGVNSALRGETHNTGTVSVPGGSQTHTVRDSRLGVGRVLHLSPANAEASAAQWYVPEVLNGEAEICFSVAPQGEALFKYTIGGVGTTRGA